MGRHKGIALGYSPRQHSDKSKPEAAKTVKEKIRLIVAGVLLVDKEEIRDSFEIAEDPTITAKFVDLVEIAVVLEHTFNLPKETFTADNEQCFATFGSLVSFVEAQIASQQAV